MSESIEAFAFEKREEFVSSVVDLLRETLQTPRTAPFAVFLSGGNTPRSIYEQITDAPFEVEPNAYIGYTDERHVSPESPESNYGLSREMLRALSIGNDRILCVETEHALEKAAYVYHQNLDDFLEKGGTIPLGLLGIGLDGHTCSLFTQADLERATDQWAIPVTRPQAPHRISVTPALLRRMERIVILALGEDKADVAEIMLTEPDTLVAGRALAGCRNVQIWLA